MDENEDFKAKSSWSASILRRGLRIGEKAAIAGAAITSAPVIVPPLFVLSTLTLAFSFPFGIYLAGCVCADKLMSVLLPLREEIDNGGLEAEDLIGVGLDGEYGDEMVLCEKNRGKSAYDLTLDSLTEEIDNGSMESEDLIGIGLDTEQSDEMVLCEKNREKSAYDLSPDSLTEEIDNGSMEFEDLIERDLDTEQDDEMVLCEKSSCDRSADDDMDENEDFKAKSSWSASILRRSLRIGKKAAIAGAAITSAPVIIPPLFVLSTLTLALSFPFGIYLAGYVCAEKLMSVLLPLREEIDNGGLEAEDLIGVGLDSEYGDEMVLCGKNRGKSGYDLTLDSLTEEIGDGGLESEDLRDRGLDSEYGDEMVLGEKNRDKSAYDLHLAPLKEEIDCGSMESEDLIDRGLDTEHGDEMVLGEKNRDKSGYDLSLNSLTEEIDHGCMESEDLIVRNLDTKQEHEMVLCKKNRDEEEIENGSIESEDLIERGLDTEQDDKMVLCKKNGDKGEIDNGSMVSQDLIERGLDTEQGDKMVLCKKRRDKEEIDNVSMESEDLIDRGLDTEQDDEMVLCEKNGDKGEIDNGSMESDDLIERGLDTEQGDEIILCKKNRDKGEIDRGEEIRKEEKIGEEDKGEFDRAITEDLRKSFFPNAENENRGEEVRDDGNVSPENRGFPKSPYSVVIMAANKESNKKEYEPPNLSSEHLSIVEGKGDDIPLKKEHREDNGEDENRLVRVANGVEVSRLKSDYVLSAVIVPSRGEDVEIFEKVGSLEHRNVGKLVPKATVGVGVAALRSHDERTHNEEQLWDQIFSIRTIVGYKATLKPSLGEEIVELYLMIGVEPPVSLKDAADLAEISNGLQFLKYVVGVK